MMTRLTVQSSELRDSHFWNVVRGETNQHSNGSAGDARDTKLCARGAKCARLGAKGGEGAKCGARDARQGANSQGMQGVKWYKTRCKRKQIF